MSEIVFKDSNKEIPPEFEYISIGIIPGSWIETLKSGYNPIFFNIETRELLLTRSKIHKGICREEKR